MELENDSFDSMLDELEEDFTRRERERRLNQGSDVYLNVYDMVESTVHSYISTSTQQHYHSKVYSTVI